MTTIETIKNRNFYYDNLKGILIFLVVFGHFIEKMPPDLGIRDLIYNFIYVFHMPLFILVSGFFSKKLKWKSIFNLILVYLLWQVIIYPTLYYILTSKPMVFNEYFIALPKFTYWYLISLITWKVITPFLPKSYFTLIIITGISFIPGLISSIDWQLFSIGRTLGLYPYFYLGYLLSTQEIEKVKYHISKQMGVAILIVVLIATYFLFIEIDVRSEALYFRKPYEDYLPTDRLGIKMRVAVLVLASLSIIGILPLIPNEKTLLCRWGENTLPIYLTHGVFISSFSKYAEFTNENVGYVLNFIVIGLVFTYGYCQLLSHEYAIKVVSKLTQLYPSSLISLMKK